MASEHRTKVDLLIAQADPATFSHGDRLIVEGVTDIGSCDGAVSRLAKNGYLKLETSKTDGRIKNVVLGKKGIARQAELSKALEAASK